MMVQEAHPIFHREGFASPPLTIIGKSCNGAFG